MAAILRVTESTVYNWEAGTTPAIEHMPSINKMIGYLPIEIDTSTLAGKAKSYRFTHGVSRPQLAAMIGVDKSTILHLEKGTYVPRRRTVMLLEKLLDEMV